MTYDKHLALFRACEAVLREFHAPNTPERFLAFHNFRKALADCEATPPSQQGGDLTENHAEGIRAVVNCYDSCLREPYRIARDLLTEIDRRVARANHDRDRTLVQLRANRAALAEAAKHLRASGDTGHAAVCQINADAISAMIGAE